MERGIRTYTTTRAALVAVGVCAAALALLSLGGLFPAAALVLCTASFAPACLMIVFFTAGLVPACTCLLMILACVFWRGGGMAAGLTALYLIAGLGTCVVCVFRRVSFFPAAGLTAAAMTAAVMVIYLLLQARTHGDLYGAAGGYAALTFSRFSYRDELLYTLVNMGFLQLPSSMLDTAIVASEGGYALSEEAVNELLLQVRSVSSGLLESLVPSLMISGSLTGSVTGLGFGIHFGRRAAQRRAFSTDTPQQDIPDLGMPPLKEWHLPRPWGLRIGLLALGYPLARMGTGSLYMLGTIMWQVFAFCFGLQGLAALNHAQHRRGSGRIVRGTVIALALVLQFLQMVLIVIGVVDQISNTRGLRPPLQPKQKEE